MTDLDRNMEIIFTMIGAIFVITIIIIAAILTWIDSGYSPMTHTISELGYYRYKTLFSIGMVAAGCLLIPFFIKLERELVNIKENLRILATGISLFTSVCTSMVGIIPDLEYLNEFLIFHIIVAAVAFAGGGTYILLYSILMYKGHQSPMYKGPQFKRYMSYYGFGVFILLIVLLIVLHPLVEWLLFLNILTWNFITAFFLRKYRFSGISGIYYKEEQYSEMLAKFEESLEILKNLNLDDDPMAEVLKENIKFLKSSTNKK